LNFSWNAAKPPSSQPCCAWRIALGQRQVAQQQELIVKLEADGQSAAHAKYLLAGLELLQAARRNSRDKLLKRLNEAK
jgi:hypothetical protein